MASQFFLYRYKFEQTRFDPANLKDSRYTPSMVFLGKYTECQGVAALTDELVPEGKYKTLPNGQISGLRVGNLEWDTSGMAALNFTDEAVVAELVNFGRDFAIKAVSKEELAGFIRAYCDLTEREPGLFVIVPPNGAETTAPESSKSNFCPRPTASPSRT
jgi:hypothetical protein